MAKIIIPAAGNIGQIVIYSRYLESFNAFVETPLADSELAEAERKTKEIPGHQRRRGPSDQIPINVRQTTASYLKDPSLKSGNALPGISFMLKTNLKMADVDMQRRFTLYGTTMDFQLYFSGKMKYSTYFYPANGGRHTLETVPIGNG